MFWRTPGFQWPLLLLVVIAAAVLYQDNRIGAKLDIVPDSTEYALAAHRFATSGNYKILVDGTWLPPRYAPWFSVLVLAPAYILLGPAIGNAIYPITIFGIIGIVHAFFLGKRIGHDWGGTTGALALLAFSKYRLWSRHIMVEIPATVLLMLACLLYARLRNGARARSMDYLLPGILISVAALFRPTFAAAALPFLLCAIDTRRWGATFRNFAVLGGPLVAAAVASAAYNFVQFGSPFRGGYNFWAPVPYDYRHLTFSLSYIAANLIVLRKTNAIYLLCLAVLMWIIDRRFFEPGKDDLSRISMIRSIGEFILLGFGPIVIFHQIYFYPADRFYLPVLVLLLVTIGALAGSWLSRLPRLALLGLLAFALIAAALRDWNKSELKISRQTVADEIVQHTPEDSWIISAVEPAYLEYMVARESKRRVVPISRRVEYADKVIASKKILDPEPQPVKWDDHRCPGLLRGGARDAVPFVAAEQLDWLAERQSRGTRIFIELAYVKPADRPIVNELEKRFTFVAQTETLFELCPRN